MTTPDDPKITMDTIRQCAPIIRQYIDRESLLPYLMQSSLLTEDQRYHFTDTNKSQGESSNYLITVLETKHSDAAKIFYQCLQSEQEHIGHLQIAESLRSTALQGNIHAVVRS